MTQMHFSGFVSLFACFFFRIPSHLSSSTLTTCQTWHLPNSTAHTAPREWVKFEIPEKKEKNRLFVWRAKEEDRECISFVSSFWRLLDFFAYFDSKRFSSRASYTSRSYHTWCRGKEEENWFFACPNSLLWAWHSARSLSCLELENGIESEISHEISSFEGVDGRFSRHNPMPWVVVGKSIIDEKQRDEHKMWFEEIRTTQNIFMDRRATKVLSTSLDGYRDCASSHPSLSRSRVCDV